MGRLDKDSEGLILLTNQGDLVNKMMRAGNYHEKEYVVTVDQKITPEFLRQMSGGLYLKELDVHTRPCTVTKVNDRTFRIILTQGYNRQIRRMCETCGYRVTRLVRTRSDECSVGGSCTGYLPGIDCRGDAEIEKADCTVIQCTERSA